MWKDKLLSVDWWQKRLALLGLLGLALIGVGEFSDIDSVVWIGITLVSPALLAGILALTIGIPYGLWVASRERRGR